MDNYVMREDLVVVKSNGELLDMEMSKVLKIRNKRRGVYESVGTGYDNLILQMRTTLENEILINIRNIPKKTFYFGWNSRRFAISHKYKINKVNIVFRKLKENHFIKITEDGQYMINPRMYIPFGCNQHLEDAYNEWENG